MRRIAAIAISIILALSTATPIALVGAQGPPTDVEATFTASEMGLVLCEFDVGFELSGKAKTIDLSGGRMIITSPGLSVTLTNLNSPENQVTLSITGAFHNTELNNGNVQTVYTGRNLFFDPLEGFVLLIGKFTGVADASTNTLVQPLEGNGQKIDACGLLD
jgi:hypothetical protein